LLLEPALEESGKEQSDKPHLDSLGFLFSTALENLRFEIESGYKTASDLAEDVRKRLVAAGKTGASDPSTLLFLVQCLVTAKLDLGEELHAVVKLLLEEAAETHSGDFNVKDSADLLGLVSDLGKQADGNPFAFYAFVSETLEGAPEEVRATMAAALLLSGGAAAAEVSVGWLLDRTTSVRRSTANALEDAARKGKLTPIMLRRMITMRNWLPEDSRAALDTAIATARRKGVSPAQWDDVEIRELVTPGVDGSGAIGVLAHCRSKRKNVLGSLLLKHGFGIRDAWAQDGVKQKEIDSAFGEISLLDQFTVSADLMRRAVGHFLAVGNQTGLMPPFGLVRFLEAVGLPSIQPEMVSTSSLLDMIEDGRAIGANAFKELLAEGSDLANDYLFLDSWFEAGDQVDAVLAASRSLGKQCQLLIMEKVLEPRREWWAQTATWAAYILYQAGNDERWQEFYAAALAMVQNCPLREISLMKMVAEQTVKAAVLRQMAA